MHFVAEAYIGFAFCVPSLSNIDLDLPINLSRTFNSVIPVVLGSSTDEREFWHFDISETVRGI
jgi:hypothetical protein